jgi:four helix bundle protein
MWYKIYDDSLLFSIQIVTISKQLKDIKERSTADQLLRSWTSIWANIREAKFAASDKDYIHKLRIALKEAN